MHGAMDPIATTSGHVVQQQIDCQLTFSSLPIDVIILIFDHLLVNEVLKLECLSRQLQMAVSMHLKVRKSIDLCICSNPCNTSNILGDNLIKRKHKIKPSKRVHRNTKYFPDITDNQFRKLLERMPTLHYIYNLSPETLDISRSLFGGRLSVEGVTRALAEHPKLQGVDINNPYLLETLQERFPHLMLGCFRNQKSDKKFHEGFEPVVELPQSDRITQIYLEDCCVETLPEFGAQLKSLYLRNLRFKGRRLFQKFEAPGLDRFVMTKCTRLERVCLLELLTTLCQLPALTCLELKVEDFQGNVLNTVLGRYSHEGPFAALQSLSLAVNYYWVVVGLVTASRSRLKTLQLDAAVSHDDTMKCFCRASRSNRSRIEHVTLGWQPPTPATQWILWSSLTETGLHDLAQFFFYLRSLEFTYLLFVENPFLWKPPTDSSLFQHLRDLSFVTCSDLETTSITAFLQHLPSLLRLTMMNVFVKPVRQENRSCPVVEENAEPNTTNGNESPGAKGSGSILHSVGKKRGASPSPSLDEPHTKKQETEAQSLSRIQHEILRLIHPKLQSLHFTNVEVEYLEIACPHIMTIHISDCEALKSVTFTQIPSLQDKPVACDLVGIQLCDCPLVDEEDLMGSISRLNVEHGMLIHLTPKHKVNVERFCEAAWSEHHGHLFVFDYSGDSSETEYNTAQVESWLPLLDHLTKASKRDFQYQDDPKGEEKKQNSVFKIDGESDKGSQWMVITDVPWFILLTECPDVDKKTAVKGMYCREAKGHRNAEEVYNNLKDHIDTVEGNRAAWFRHTVITYVNMCGTDSQSVAVASSEKHL